MNRPRTAGKTDRQRAAFSMVEIALALGVISFAFLALLALLPEGVKSNRVSVEETRATFILTSLEADLKNTHPLANGGKSRMFGLALPYQFDTVSGAYKFNTTLNTAGETLTGSVNTTGLKESEEPENLNAAARSRYQVTVIYTRVPAEGSLQAAQARLIVNWPSIVTNSARDLTDLGKVSGFVETTVSFPAP